MSAKRRPGRRGSWWVGLGVVASIAAAGWLVISARSAKPPASMDAIRTLAAAGRWGEAEALLGRRIEADPGDGQARVMKALILANRRRPEEAIGLLRGVPESDPVRARAAAMIGELEFQAHRAPEAERAFREAASRDPRNVEARQRLIHLLSLQQRHGEARDALWELYRVARDPRMLADLVVNLWAYENDARGLGAELDAFLARSPRDPYLRRAKGLALLMQGRSDEALPHLEAAAEALRDDPVGRFALAECRLTLGRFRGDESILGPRPAPPADAARWWVFRGRLQEALGRPDDALASFREALRANPIDAEVQYRLGQALRRLGRDDESRRHLERASAIKEQQADLRREVAARRKEFGSDSSPYETLGRLCREAGLVAEARAWFELATRADPSNSSARSALAALSKAPDACPVPLSRPMPGVGDLSERRPPEATPTGSPSAAGRLHLEDVSGPAGISYQYDPAASGNLYLGDTMGGGVGLIDFDGDGWLDIYFVNGCPLPIDPKGDPPGANRLYRNRGDGTFEDVTKRAGVPGRGYGMGCAVGDFDGDGHDDLFVTGLGSTVLYRNRGDGTFEDVTKRAGVGSDRWTTAAGFGDLDGDGDLDLVVVTYVEADPVDVPACRDGTGRPLHCSPARFPAQADLLFRNNGDGTFADVSRESGIDAAPDGRGLGLAIADLDGDGRLDVFVANDLSPDFLFLNRGGLRFEEAGMTAGVALNGSGRATASMGVVADDLDGDGLTDLFVTNFLNEPNTLFHNLGHGLFADATLGANLATSSLTATGFGVAAPDFDNDGHPDLFITNGHVDDQPWLNSPMAQPPQAFLGLGGGRYGSANGSASPYLARHVVGRGLAAGDLDNDGRVDLVVVHRDSPAVVLRNLTPGGHWLGLRLRGTRSGPTPVGVRVTCRSGGREQVRILSSGTSYLSSHDLRLWFGLGTSTRVESLHVRWPSGLEQDFTDLPADRIFELREGDSAPKRLEGGHRSSERLQGGSETRGASPRPGNPG